MHECVWAGSDKHVRDNETEAIVDFCNKLEKEKPYLLKNKPPSGGGAPISRPSSDNFSEDMLKPFLKATEDITEQGRIFKTYGKETWQKLRDIAKTR